MLPIFASTSVSSAAGQVNLALMYWGQVYQPNLPTALSSTADKQQTLWNPRSPLWGGGAVISGTGVLAAQSATMSGVGIIEKTSSGVLTSQSATMSGAGGVGSGIFGTGALVAQSATMSGSGLIENTSSGNLVAQSATLSGVAAVTSTIAGSGSLLSQAATMSGSVEAPDFIEGVSLLILSYDNQYYSSTTT